jgi:hypothetical protein
VQAFLKRARFILLWIAIVALFTGYGAFGGDFSEATRGAASGVALGFCIATCAVGSLIVILKVRAQRLAKWMGAIIVFVCSMLAALIPPLFMSLTGLFHGESGLVILAGAVLCFWIAFGTFLICAIVLICLPKEAGAKMKLPLWLIIILVTLVGTGFLLWPIRVGKRITAIDLSRLYPKIDDYYEGRKGYVQRAGTYPSIGGGDYYNFPSTNGSITVQVMLDDFGGWTQNLQAEKREATSRRIGEQSFFGDWRHSADKDFELAYRRLNVSAVFHFNSSKPNVIRTGDYKTELEYGATVLDQAILSGTPAVQSEYIRFGQVVSQKIKDLPGVVFWVYSLFGPK